MRLDQQTSQVQTKGPRILLVDDEVSIQEILNLTLKPAGYHLYPVGTGRDALQTFQSTRPELILLDLFLPDMDGRDVLRELRKQTTSPILIMSVRHEESEKIACLDAGADDYLTKPFTMGELLARLRAALRQRLEVKVTMCFRPVTSKWTSASGRCLWEKSRFI